jgi:hypothetical protein
VMTRSMIVTPPDAPLKISPTAVCISADTDSGHGSPAPPCAPHKYAPQYKLYGAGHNGALNCRPLISLLDGFALAAQCFTTHALLIFMFHGCFRRSRYLSMSFLGSALVPIIVRPMRPVIAGFLRKTSPQESVYANMMMQRNSTNGSGCDGVQNKMNWWVRRCQLEVATWA